MRFIFKLLITALIIVSVSEIGKRSPLWASVLASLPLTSILAITWLYADTHDAEQVCNLTTGIFWAVLPSLVFFLVLPLLLRQRVRFELAMIVSCAATSAAYAIYVYVSASLRA